MPPSPPVLAAVERRRALYAAELSLGTDRFTGPRRDDCPWCGSSRLRTRLRGPDLLQRKPGTFVLDQCRDCEHAFQNPPLTAEGLAFHHGDIHDGHLEDFAERLLAAGSGRRRHRHAARAILALEPEPESWLDVGTGRAHFPRTARELFPYTAFDAVGTTGRVEEARRAGWIDEAHRGQLTTPGVLARLRSRYDVVSMFHHLEHTPDPRAELHAALAALRPGGHLLVEMADPRSHFAVLLGKWWLPQGQPRHLHLMPPANLRAELEARGCTVLRTDRRAPHIPHDLSAALALALSHAFPAPDAPWRTTPPSALRQTLRAALLGATSPLVDVAALLDHTLAPLLRRTRFSNTYRLIARKERPDGPADD
ncbi:class I SAM-dependent methyltransferase [Streptomyces sp. NPDC004542]|uniref:class I SAM-dependent methyltransferase n=1 Tax=Streptomyces sp. NPDC004542 TaxID=3154281 RepID=UPI0033B7AD07